MSTDSVIPLRPDAPGPEPVSPLLVVTGHTDGEWRVVSTDRDSQWTITVPRSGFGSPRLKVRYRDHQGFLGADVDCGAIGSPDRFGSWNTQEEFVAFCTNYLRLVRPESQSVAFA